MVDYRNVALDRTFAALADPTRRALLARLTERSCSISELAEPFPMTLAAVIKHLDVLTDAGLIARNKSGRTVTCRLTPAPMEDAVTWLNHYECFWRVQLDRLTDFVENERWPTAPASPSGATSRRRLPRSSAPGRTRRK